jgi:phage baseplate assembly protein W
MLFELITPQITHYIGKQIELLIKNYEPRCRLTQVNNMPNLEKNGYPISISFYVVNNPIPVIVESFLERLR